MMECKEDHLTHDQIEEGLLEWLYAMRYQVIAKREPLEALTSFRVYRDTGERVITIRLERTSISVESDSSICRDVHDLEELHGFLKGVCP